MLYACQLHNLITPGRTNKEITNTAVVRGVQTVVADCYREEEWSGHDKVCAGSGWLEDTVEQKTTEEVID